MSRLTTSNLIRFSPGAGDGGDESDPVSRFELSLSTRLEGGATSRGAAAARLSATLIVAFAFALVMGLCKRLRLTGITIGGHADLTIPGAAYNDSTCAYAGPEESDPLTVYLDQDPETAIAGWTLKIHWPNQNWYPAFDWPGPLYAVDPPFGDDEQRPPTLFKLKAFEAHTSRWTEDDDGTPVFEDYGGVRIPMKLVLDPGMSRPYRVVKDLTGEDCPVLTGGGTSITLKDGGPVFEVTMEEIADALTGLTDLYGADDREGVYSLKWIVYKGDGDMIYEAECYDGSSLGTYTDRRTGAGGVFETDSKDVARIKAVKAPETFLLADTDYLYTFDTSGTPVRTLKSGSYGAGTRAWFGASGEILTWAGSSIYLGAWRYVAPTPVRCACLVTRTITQTPPDDPPGEEPRTESLLCLQVFGEDRRLYWYPFASGEWRYVGTAPDDPSYECPAVSVSGFTRSARTISADPDSCEFSQNGNQILIAARPLFSTYGYPGVLWTSDLMVGIDLASLGDWARVHVDPPPELSQGEQLNINSTAPLIGTQRFLIAAGYRGDTRIVQQAELKIESRPKDYIFSPKEAWSYSFGRVDNMRAVFYTLTESWRSQSRSVLSVRILENDDAVLEVTEAGLTETQIQRERVTVDGFSYNVDGHEETEEYAYYEATFMRDIVLRTGPSEQATVVEEILPDTTRRLDDVVRLQGLMNGRYGIRRGGFSVSLGAAETIDGVTTYPKDAQALAGKNVMIQLHGINVASTAPWALSYPSTLSGLANFLGYNAQALLFNANAYKAYTAQAPDDTILAYLEVSGAGATALSTGVAFSPQAEPALGVTALFEPPAPNLEWPDIPTWSSLERPTAADLLKAHNAVRQELGLAALTLNTELSQAAALHVAWMDETGIFSHEGRNDSTPMQRAADAGYDGFVGENLAMGYPTIAEVMSGWQASPDHWENILDPNWRDVGVFIWPSTTLGYFLWCVVFGFKSA